ncbi:MAG TPA: nuclear transport factor 2 family protein [Candidatus Elarobacter sp.]|nr:nuclear transport factor 2 family protein [Candidatus Elarobacter sp.]
MSTSVDTLATLLDAFGHRDLAGAVGCFAEDGAYREPRKPALVGRDAIAAHFARFAAAGRDWRFEVDAVISDGRSACVVYRFAAEGGGDRGRERAGCATVRFDEHGRIAEWREYEG